MAALTLTIPDGDVDRIVAAYEEKFGERNAASGETKAEFMKRSLAQQMNFVLLQGELIASTKATRTNFVPVPIT